MRVMTFNIWNYNPHWPVRRDLLADLIARYQPDAVALQETRHDFRYERGRGQGEQLAERTGYHATSATAQVYIPVLRVDEGLTVLTRAAPEEVEVRRLTLHPHDRQDENHRVALAVALTFDGRRVHIVDTHFSLSAMARQTNAVEVAQFVAARAGAEPAVVMGDLNAEPDAPEIRYLGGEIELLGERAAFVDCWTAAHPDRPGFTYASDRPYQRIDYVFARGFAAGPTHAEIIGREDRNGIYPSDHLGIVVDLPL